MRSAWTAAAMLALAAPGVARADAARCPDVPIQPNSDFVAVRVEAVEVSCAQARDLILAVIRDRRASGEFSCSAQVEQNPRNDMAHTDWSCTTAAARVAWTQY